MGFIGPLLSIVGNAGVQGFKAQQANIDENIQAKKEAALEKRKQNLLAIAHQYNTEDILLKDTLAKARETKLENLRAQNERKNARIRVEAQAKLPIERIKSGAKLLSDVFGLPIKEATKLWMQKDKTGDINKVINLTEEVRKLEEDGDIAGANRLLEEGANEGVELGWRLAVIKDKKGNKHIKGVTVAEYRRLKAPIVTPTPGPNPTTSSSFDELYRELNKQKEGAFIAQQAGQPTGLLQGQPIPAPAPGEATPLNPNLFRQ